jgi:hypothetical protein
MSALGQKQTFALQKDMSALPPKADICGATRDVRLVPSDIAYVLTSLQRQRDDRLQQAGAYSGAAMSGNSITTIRCAAPSNYLNAL